MLRIVCTQRRRFTDTADAAEGRARNVIGGAAIQLIEELNEEGFLSVEKPSWAAGQLLGMIEHATLLYGLIRGDKAQTHRHLHAIGEDAVITFLSRYGVRGKGG
jgi:hypothetical protein